MNKGVLLAIAIFVATIFFVAVGTIWPIPSAVYYAGGAAGLGAPTTPEAAAGALGAQIKLNAWDAAYGELANKGQFSQQQFRQDLAGTALSLRTYATLASFDLQPLHQSADAAEVLMKLHWSSVVGPFDDTRDLHLVRNGGRWAVEWPLVKTQPLPPQVIPVNYLRWDVIYRGAGDDWGSEDVEAPHVRIVDMHPVNRADGVVVMGELLNEDVVPAFVSVQSTLLGKNGAVLGTAGSFDMILHTLLPKQVTPFFIQFPGIDISQVGSIRMQPISTLVPASADPVIEVQNQKFNPAPGAALTGQLANQSGQIVNVAHILSTFYDKNGQLVWVADRYTDRAMYPETPLDFRIPVPEDLAKQVATERTVVATYVTGTNQ